VSGEEISTSRRWLAKRGGNEGELPLLPGEQGLRPLLDTDLDRSVLCVVA